MDILTCRNIVSKLCNFVYTGKGTLSAVSHFNLVYAGEVKHPTQMVNLQPVFDWWISEYPCWMIHFVNYSKIPFQVSLAPFWLVQFLWIAEWYLQTKECLANNTPAINVFGDNVTKTLEALLQLNIWLQQQPKSTMLGIELDTPCWPAFK